MRHSKHSAATGLLSLCLLAGTGGSCMAANASGTTVDAASIAMPTDEATLAEFVGKLKAAYIDRPSGLVTTKLGASPIQAVHRAFRATAIVAAGSRRSTRTNVETINPPCAASPAP